MGNVRVAGGKDPWRNAAPAAPGTREEVGDAGRRGRRAGRAQGAEGKADVGRADADAVLAIAQVEVVGGDSRHFGVVLLVIVEGFGRGLGRGLVGGRRGGRRDGVGRRRVLPFLGSKAMLSRPAFQTGDILRRFRVGDEGEVEVEPRAASTTEASVRDETVGLTLDKRGRREREELTIRVMLMLVAPRSDQGRVGAGNRLGDMAAAVRGVGVRIGGHRSLIATYDPTNAIVIILLGRLLLEAQQGSGYRYSIIWYLWCGYT